MRDTAWQDGAKTTLQKWIVAGLGIGHAVPMTERKGALADALEHDGVQITLLYQLNRWIEPISRKPGARADTKPPVYRHFVTSLTS